MRREEVARYVCLVPKIALASVSLRNERSDGRTSRRVEDGERRARRQDQRHLVEEEAPRLGAFAEEIRQARPRFERLGSRPRRRRRSRRPLRAHRAAARRELAGRSRLRARSLRRDRAGFDEKIEVRRGWVGLHATRASNRPRREQAQSHQSEDRPGSQPCPSREGRDFHEKVTLPLAGKARLSRRFVNEAETAGRRPAQGTRPNLIRLGRPHKQFFPNSVDFFNTHRIESSSRS